METGNQAPRDSNNNQANQSSNNNKKLSYSGTIVETFKQEQLDKNVNYFSEKTKEEISDDFVNFVRTTYGEKTLEGLRSQKGIDVAFNEIANKGFKLSDFTNHKKKNVVKILKSTMSEKTAIEDTMMNLYEKRKTLDPGIQSQMPFDEFVRQTGIHGEQDPSTNAYTKFTLSNPRVTGNSIKSLEKAWKSFVEAKVPNNNQKGEYQDFFQTGFKSQEKLACIASVDVLKNKIYALGNTNAEQVWKDVFGNYYQSGNISALCPWTNTFGLQQALEEFFRKLSVIGLDDSTFHDIKNTRVTSKDLITYGKLHHEIHPSKYEQGKYESQRFSEMSEELAEISNGMFEADLVSNLEGVLEDVESIEENYKSIYSLPGNLKDFFGQFGSPNAAKASPHSPEIRKKTIEIKRLREKLATLTGQDKIDAEKKLDDLKEELADLNVNKSFDTREAYFSYIGNQVDAACDNIGVNRYGSNLKTVLSKLQSNNRNVTKISQSEQSLIMKAAIDIKLSGMKNTDILGQVGQNFDLYRQFVSNLYDFNSDTADFRFKTGEKVTLKFAKDENGNISKKLVGKPSEFDNISIHDISSLDKIRVEFEVDLDASSEGVTELLQTITGRSVIRKPFWRGKPNFPETITDSSFVKIEDKHGNIYEGYLSPSGSGFMDDSVDIEQDNSESFILYSEPADKLSETRKIEIMRDENGKEITKNNKGVAVAISRDNIGDFKSIKVEKNRATLANNSLNALTLAHKLAEQATTKEQAKLDEVLSNLDKEEDFADARKKSQQDTRDLGESKISNEKEDAGFMRAWDALTDNNNKVELKEGVRLAVKLKDKNNNNLDGHIAITVKKIIKADGVIQNIELAFETLDYPANINIPNKIWNEHQLRAFGNSVVTSSSFGLPKPDASFDEKKQAIGKESSLISGLDFDEKQKSLMKGTEKISHFINPKGNKKEYTIIPTGNNEFEISGKKIDTEKDKDGKEKKIRYIVAPFKTTTEGMLQFIKSNNLSAYTQQEKNIYENTNPEDNEIPKKDNKRWSFSTIWNVIKGDGKKLIDKLKEKRGKEKEDELRYRMFVEGGIWRKLDGMFGWLLEKFDINAFDDLADEVEANGLTYGWDKINGIYEHLNKFHHGSNINVPEMESGDLDENGNPKKGTGSTLMVYGMIQSGIKSFPNLSYKQRFKIAGSLLHMLEKFKSGYAKEMKDLPNGTYVKLLLGNKNYENFIDVYKSKEAALNKNNPETILLQEQLAFLEYNYIVDNLRGGALQNQESTISGGNPGHFQRLYGRKFANELSTKISQAKQVDMNPTGEKVKALVETADFEHIYGEYINHISSLRIEESLQEIVALQQMARTKDQQNRVIIGLMAGYMNGTFVRHIGSAAKAQLKSLARNLGIIRGKRTEHYNAPEKIKNFLITASGGEFENFRYGKSTKRAYNRSDFTSTHRETKIYNEFAGDFIKRGGWDKVLKFMSGENLTDDPKNSMIHIRKSENLPEIYGRTISKTEKDNIDEIMRDFYTNKDRSADINLLNYNPGFYNHRTMIENQQLQWNTLEKGNFKSGTMDHAETYRGTVLKNLPEPKKLGADKKDMLRYYVDEFFRSFNGIGNINYTDQQIAEFYKYIRLAQKQKNKNDQKRLIRAQPIMQAYAGGDGIPPIVAKALAKSLKFFEENLDLFGPETGRLHIKPGLRTIPAETFESIFTDNHLFDYNYIPKSERDKTSKSVKTKWINQEDARNNLLINQQIDNLKNMRGKGGKNIVNVDNIILQLNKDNFKDESYVGDNQSGILAASTNSDNVVIPSESHSHRYYNNDAIGNPSPRPKLNPQEEAAQNLMQQFNPD